ncbi:MAG: phosphoribosyl-AMP cyclohydrolase [Abditibacteriota bacterium]|nr:phosphoribosyl-AMP cyclohydrolase [Abditibacteriota bacterium]MBP5092927.1 phosphoribosyl-AMP cyclohydrolase [Abditibacteriota bacterium]MBP5738469.1 phosphoribosyl-AMP cyclohydrolase [Abditibacteriota bacterium]
MIEQFLDGLKYDKDGLIPGVVQDADNGDVLMVAYMNKDAVRETLTSGRACFWSRSRQTFWIKGETSGNIQKVKEVYVDCDKDCFVIKVEQTGAACHEGYRSCFFRKVDSEGNTTIVLKKLMDSY